MAETATVTPVNADVKVAQPVNQPFTQQPKPEPDLITKVSQFKKAEPENKDPELANFDYKQIEGLDAKGKELFIKYYKDEQRKFTKKFQDLADEKKNLDTERNTPWTPERVNKLLADHNFLEAAKQVTAAQGQRQTDDTSLLTDEEKAKLAQVDQMKEEMSRLKVERLQNAILQKDTELKNRFADYEPKIVDNALGELAQMQPQELRPYIWKAINYERDIERAYELGRQEKNSSIQDKVNSLSSAFGNANPADILPARDKGETDQSYFLKLADRRLQESKKNK